jgi:4-diphosphocytidyl-2-C-methyl-D-erythritol kinase
MTSVASSTVVHTRAPGKINVFLEVGDVADDGYHEVATAYQAVSLYAEITATPADEDVEFPRSEERKDSSDACAVDARATV